MSLRFKEVLVDLNTESADLRIINASWYRESSSIVGVKFNALDVMSRWDHMAESKISDAEYEEFINKESRCILALTKRLKPNNIKVLRYSIDDEEV